MNNDKKNITIAVVISLIFHILLLTLGYIYYDALSYSPPKEEIIEIDLRTNDFKIADITPPKVEEVPDHAKHIGMYDSKVTEETVATQTIRAPGRPESRGGKGIKKLKKEADKFYKSERLSEPKPKPDQIGMSPSFRNMPEDFYPDYKRGPHTYINVLKHLDVGYFVRLKRVFKLAWDPTTVLMRRRVIGEISRGSIKVVLGIAIDSTGEISELFVINGSGMGDYDGEALRAVRASAPFSSPPKKLLAKDGILRISWSFVVYM